MNKKMKVGAVAGIALVAVVILAVWATRRDDRKDVLTLYGNVDIREVELGFRVPGRLVKMNVDEGDSITAGQIIAELDAAPCRDALAGFNARLAQTEANLNKLKRGSRPQEVQQAAARVVEVEANVRNTERDFQRQRRLAQSGAVSQKVLDAALAARDQTVASLASSRQALALAKEGFRSEDIAAGQAELATAQAQVDQAQTQLQDTTLMAPSDGAVLTRAREPGSVIAQGATVYTLSLRHPVYVRAYVSEPDLGKLAPGSTVQVVTDSSNKRYEGKVGFISPRAEFTPKTVETAALRTDLVYRLRIVVDQADESLRQGMPVTIQMPPVAANEKVGRG